MFGLGLGGDSAAGVRARPPLRGRAASDGDPAARSGSRCGPCAQHPAPPAPPRLAVRPPVAARWWGAACPISTRGGGGRVRLVRGGGGGCPISTREGGGVVGAQLRFPLARATRTARRRSRDARRGAGRTRRDGSRSRRGDEAGEGVGGGERAPAFEPFEPTQSLQELYARRRTISNAWRNVLGARYKASAAPPPPPPLVLSGHAASLTPY